METALLMARVGLTTAAVACEREVRKRNARGDISAKKYAKAATALRAAQAAIDSILNDESEDDS